LSHRRKRPDRDAQFSRIELKILCVRLGPLPQLERGWIGLPAIPIHRLPRLESVRGPGINIAVGSRLLLHDTNPFQPGTFAEYAHLQPWADVGNIDIHSPFDVVVVHEVAHAFQFGGTRPICDRLGLPLTAKRPAHGRLFAEIYARLRTAFGMVMPGRPRWLQLPPDARERALLFRRLPLPADIERAAIDPAGYRREMRARNQRQRRMVQPADKQ